MYISFSSFLESHRHLCFLKLAEYQLKKLFFSPKCLLPALICCHWHFPPIFCVSELFLLFFSMSVTTPSSQSIFISCFLTAALPKGNFSVCAHACLPVLLTLISCTLHFSHLLWTSLTLAIKSCSCSLCFCCGPSPLPCCWFSCSLVCWSMLVFTAL